MATPRGFSTAVVTTEQADPSSLHTPIRFLPESLQTAEVDVNKKFNVLLLLNAIYRASERFRYSKEKIGTTKSLFYDALVIMCRTN
jgi:hypothetical protein